MFKFSIAYLLTAGLFLPIARNAVAAPPSISNVYDFTGHPDGSDPDGALLSWHGKLWGTTFYGGTGDTGSVFSVDPATKKKRIVYSFSGGADGANPSSRLTLAGDKLYGTTYAGGSADWGVVFSITNSGVEKVIHAFTNAPDGALTQSGLTLFHGILYGVTAGGGDTSCNGGSGCGIAYKIDPTSDTYAKIAGFSLDFGWYPVSDLIAVGDLLYGTASSGGKHTAGVVFSMSTAGHLKAVYDFTGNSDGGYPTGSLLYETGKLYGTTRQGGSDGAGVAFSLTTGGQQRVLYTFQSNGSGDGAMPNGGLVKYAGRLWGTTNEGGVDGAGVVFTLTSNGSEKAYSLGGVPNGAAPQAGLIVVGSTIYGTAGSGGNVSDCGGFGCGTVFSVTP